jgi:hypothetical protein
MVCVGDVRDAGLVGYTLDPAKVPPHATAKAWARFCAKTVVTNKHVIWVGALSKGYGTFTDVEFRDLDLELADHRPTVTATRWLWSAFHGPIDLHKLVMHACDLPICVKLTDLEPGSQQENIQTAANRDRLARRRGRVRVDKADTRGAGAQSRAIRHAVLKAIDDGITDPDMLDWIVAAVLAEGDPDSVSAHVPLFRIAEVEQARHARRNATAAPRRDAIPASATIRARTTPRLEP